MAPRPRGWIVKRTRWILSTLRWVEGFEPGRSARQLSAGVRGRLLAVMAASPSVAAEPQLVVGAREFCRSVRRSGSTARLRLRRATCIRIPSYPHLLTDEAGCVATLARLARVPVCRARPPLHGPCACVPTTTPRNQHAAVLDSSFASGCERVDGRPPRCCPGRTAGVSWRRSGVPPVSRTPEGFRRKTTARR